MIRGHIKIVPRPFARPRFNNGRGFNDPKYAAYKKELSLSLWQLIKAPPTSHMLMTGALHLQVLFILKMPKTTKKKHPVIRPDLDNYVKAFMDAANEYLWHDDAQVVKLQCEKRYGDEPGIMFCVLGHV